MDYIVAEARWHACIYHYAVVWVQFGGGYYFIHKLMKYDIFHVAWYRWRDVWCVVWFIVNVKARCYVAMVMHICNHDNNGIKPSHYATMCSVQGRSVNIWVVAAVINKGISSQCGPKTNRLKHVLADLITSSTSNNNSLRTRIPYTL